ncbi:hypothetical protein TELCIR_06842 [Teladorsagia circumcincta]|uniref:Bardet-Biedl syndrome 1 N-terminal domain-containing protein n=1 Tax=Teladorsagia circumcincta TaxID=45464 RepID=A0A2G9ULW9_TELCI|nr:hypothetical protein TELCIR_06842 [Teladorsagia circumcincta]
MSVPETVKWMSALSDEQAGVFTFSHCVCLSDMYGDGDTKLVLAHVGSSKFNMRLKVFKGVTVVGESALADMPTAIVSFYNEKISPKELTPLSQTLLVTKAEDRAAFIDYYAIPKYVNNLQNPATVTCLSSMPKSSLDNIDVLVFGTERGMVRAVDSQAFQIIADCCVVGIPVQIVTYGVFDIDYRIFVSTRDGNIFSIKRDQTVKEKPIITCKTNILAVATTNHMLMFFSFAGKCLNTIPLGEPIRGLELFQYAPKQFEGVLVLLENQIRLYTHLHLLDIMRFDRPLSWIKFGPFGREEGALIIGTKDGGLLVKLFRRKASLDEKIDLAPQPKAYNIKLNIPKKSKIFIDQTVRERENVNQINQTYQRDLFLIKHHTTTAFAALAQTAATSISTDPNHSVDIAVTVNGFGPKFRITIKLSCAT